MEFIPETLRALGELDPHFDSSTLLAALRSAADQAQAIAPGLAGVSVASRGSHLVFTLVATDEEVASLDALQYLTSGPCVEATDQGLATESADLLSEPRWRELGRASAASGIRSTLTLPIMEGDEVIGTVNLYGRHDHTFDGRHEALAAVFQAWAPGAVTNADLSFSTRGLAQAAADHLRDDALIEMATGIIAASFDLPLDAAREQLVEAASRAGVPEARLARMIVELHDDAP